MLCAFVQYLKSLQNGGLLLETSIILSHQNGERIQACNFQKQNYTETKSYSRLTY